MSATATPPRPAPLDSPREGGAGRPDGPMTWEDVCAHPALQDLPFKVEQDRYGRIVMSPPFARHARLQYKIARMLEDALGGVPATEAPVETRDGVKVPDVVWMSDEFAAEHAEATVYRVAPDVCVEVMSRSNSWAEMSEKVTLYLARGAQEVWVCEADGRLRFFGHEGERERSVLAPDAPVTVTL
ncbi:Uma2 family endonuclease [Rubrivirga sp. S365]|uniref:Uma2 family endonuclease n=1 Tax=Rubrivirga litoralis TaxID=3075598 RepID=A0ABU3BLP0_9BACT|nr:MULTISPECIES: Uma2 family endonuclease [unclassified Rubrivirga]MDT0630190.1 Uma2 family endonuclease [Rubrivirga sp. F394]MDT7855701.1 Uma2 family endonuclease [Rubrivirga sp. S365]